MKAVVQIELSSNRAETRAGEQPRLGMKAVWVKGNEPAGDLTIGQILSMLKLAEGYVLSQVPFDPPEKQIEVVPAGTIKELTKLVN